MASLNGRTIAITGQRRAGEMAEIVQRLGGVPFLAPTVSLRFEESEEEAQRLARVILEGVDWAVFYTGVGVRAIFAAAERLDALDSFREKLGATKILSRGRKSLRALRENGCPPDLEAEPGTTEGVIRRLLEAGIEKGASIFVQTPGAMPAELPRALSPLGVRLIHGSPYRITPPEDPESTARLIRGLLEGGIDAIAFTSPPAVNNLFLEADERGQAEELAEALGGRVLTASIGPVTSAAIRENGVEPALETESQRMGALLQELADFLSNQKSKSGASL